MNALPHVDNIYTLVAVVATGVFHWLTARASKKRTITIKYLVNGRLSETLLRNAQLAHTLSEHGIPIPPPSTPVIRNIIVKGDPDEGHS